MQDLKLNVSKDTVKAVREIADVFIDTIDMVLYWTDTRCPFEFERRQEWEAMRTAFLDDDFSRYIKIEVDTEPGTRKVIGLSPITAQLFMFVEILEKFKAERA